MSLVTYLALVLVLSACSPAAAMGQRAAGSSAKEDRAPWRGSAWDNADSIRAGLARGQCWPLIEDTEKWRPCNERAEKRTAFAYGNCWPVFADMEGWLLCIKRGEREAWIREKEGLK